MLRPVFRHIQLFVLMLITVAAFSRDARAQLLTQHIKGGVGLKAGSQPPPGGYIIAPLLYFYSTDTVKNREGDKLPFDAEITTTFFGAGTATSPRRRSLVATTGSRSWRRWAPTTASRGRKSTRIPARD